MDMRRNKRGRAVDQCLRTSFAPSGTWDKTFPMRLYAALDLIIIILYVTRGASVQ